MTDREERCELCYHPLGGLGWTLRVYLGGKIGLALVCKGCFWIMAERQDRRMEELEVGSHE